MIQFAVAADTDDDRPRDPLSAAALNGDIDVFLITFSSFHPRSNPRNLMATQIGVQMYTLRDYCKTPADIASTCKRVADMGFGAIQVSAFGPIDTKELRKILDDTGLVCAATHVSYDLMKDTQACLDYHHTLGCKLTALGFINVGGNTKAHWQTFADEFNAVGKKLAAGGVTLGYHNHAHEFMPFAIADAPSTISPKDTPYAFLAGALDKSIWFELDTHWVQRGGASPSAWIDKLAGRLPAIHVKDMTIAADKSPLMCEVGLGNLDWPAILAAAKRAKVEWYLIERDTGLLDPFESLKISREKMLEMGLK